MAKKSKSSNKHPLLSLKVQSKPKVKTKRKKTSLQANRSLHKKILLHPISIFTLLVAFVFVFSWTYYVIADTVKVTAIVPAQSLSQAAVITNLYNNESLTQSPVTVLGSCPASSYVKLYRNNVFSGVAWCNNGEFSIATSLFTGANVLLAQDYNITDSPGPASSTVNVNYVIPSASVSPTTKNSTPSQSSQVSSNVPPLFLVSDFHYQTVHPGHPYTWTININGGVSPFNIKVAWGDGQTSALTFNNDATFTISHIFNKGGYYVIQVSERDKIGDTTSLQLAAFVRQAGSVGVFNPNPPSAQTTSSSQSSSSLFKDFGLLPNWLKIAWPSLIVVMLMLISFWLGEREEYTILKHTRRRAHRV